MFNVGAGEMVFILVAALLVLGPSRLPEMARAIGKFMREFRRQTDDVRGMVEREFYKMDEEELRAPTPAGPETSATRDASPAPTLVPAPHAVARSADREEAPLHAAESQVAGEARVPGEPEPRGEG